MNVSRRFKKKRGLRVQQRNDQREGKGNRLEERKEKGVMLQKM